MAAVTLRGLGKTYAGATRPAVAGVDLQIRDGEFVVFVGPSGCGKSTLLRMIAGLEEITTGSLKIGADEVSDLPPRARNVAMVFQDYALYPHKTVFENMAFGLKMRGTPAAEISAKVDAAAQTLKISELLQRKPRELSGGQRQRVAIGRAMVRNPQVFLFDEPLSNLDAQLRGVMRGEIKRLHQRLGKTMIYVTHDQVEAMTLADRIVVLRDGSVEQFGTPAQIYKHPASVFVAGFTGSPAMNFAPASLHRHDNAVALNLGNLTLPLPQTHPAQDADLLDRPLTFGLRPEHLAPGALPQGPDEVVVQAETVLIEPLGANVQITLAIAGHEFITLIDAEQPRPVPGESVNVTLRLHHAHFFDPSNGRNVDSPTPARFAHADDETFTI
jgi:multiple sugar transport system ATP-binding protein